MSISEYFFRRTETDTHIPFLPCTPKEPATRKNGRCQPKDMLTCHGYLDKKSEGGMKGFLAKKVREKGG